MPPTVVKWRRYKLSASGSTTPTGRHLQFAFTDSDSQHLPKATVGSVADAAADDAADNVDAADDEVMLNVS